MDPSRPIRRQATGWNNAMDVRVMLQILSPGVQDAEKSDVGAEVLWVGGDLG